MIVFYAWTNLQIVNYVNLKTNYYKHSEVYLIVFMLERISDELLYEVKKSNVFETVIELKKPESYLERKRKGFVEYIKSVSNGVFIKKHIVSQLKNSIGDKKCDKLVTAAFWSETMYIYRYFRRTNKQLEIELIEEGLSCYNAPKDWLFKTSPSLSLKGRIRSLIYYGALPKLARKHTTGIYLYLPEISTCNKVRKRYRLPVITDKNQPCYNIVMSMARYSNDEYKNRMIIFAADAPRINMDNPYQYVYKALDAILIDNKTANNVVVKMHPTNSTLDCSFEYVCDGLYVDYRKEALEFITCDMPLSNKIIIANNSASVYNIIGSLGKNPYIIFMHKICQVENAQEEYRNDELAKKLKEIYSYSERIGIPENIEELERILHSFIKEIRNEDINKNREEE